ncbi:MAG TPA: hypothetical protein VIL20_13180 [Sandaracinaceae bacterium]
MSRLATVLLALAPCACGGPLVVWHGHSPDRAHRARILEEGGSQRVLVDGEPGPTVDAVALTSLRWSARGLAYAARLDGRWHVVHGQELGPPHDAIGEIATAGSRLAYAALDGERWRVVVDGEPGPAFTSLARGTLRFFADGRRFVYVGRDQGRARVVIDGEAGPSFEAIERLSIGGKGALIAYVGWEGERASLVVDSRVRGTYDEVIALELASAEPRFAAIVTYEGAPAIVHDGAIVARPPRAARLAISADGARVAWVVPHDDREEVWLDGARVAAHDAVTDLGFVPRTGALLYVARDAERVRVVHGGRPGPPALEIVETRASAAGHFGYVARRGAGRFVVIDGALRWRGEWAGGLALAERSDRWAFVVRRAGRRFVVTPEGETPVERPFVDTLVLDPSGAHWAIAVADRRARRVAVVVDGRPHATLDLDEVAAAITQGVEPAEAVRAIVAGELARALAAHQA